jgi:hypothetical protein
MSSPPGSRLPLGPKVQLAIRVWRSYLRVRRDVKETPLPRLARDLAETRAGAPRHAPELLSHAVGRALRVGRHQPRCLIGALVLFQLLSEQGDKPELVIGLPPEAVDQTAHAWVELDGRDIGPPPGGRRHVAFVRYP